MQYIGVVCSPKTWKSVCSFVHFGGLQLQKYSNFYFSTCRWINLWKRVQLLRNKTLSGGDV